MTYLQVETQGPVVIIRLANPPVNALCRPLLQGLAQQLDQLATGAEQTRIVVLAGAGPKAFAAGGDVTEFPGLATEQLHAWVAESALLLEAVQRFPLPVIAAIHGYCIGGGLELAATCDIRVAAASAQFGLPEIKLGLTPGAGGMQRLARIIPPGMARMLVYTGKLINAAEAHRIGLVDVLVDEHDPVPQAMDLAAEIARYPASSLCQAKKVLVAASYLPLAEGLRVEQAALAECMRSAEGQEGVRAFLDKRQPRWNL